MLTDMLFCICFLKHISKHYLFITFKIKKTELNELNELESSKTHTIFYEIRPWKSCKKLRKKAKQVVLPLLLKLHKNLKDYFDEQYWPLSWYWTGRRDDLPTDNLICRVRILNHYYLPTGCSLNIVFLPKHFVIFLNSASSAAALVFYLPGVCTHTDTEEK